MDESFLRCLSNDLTKFCPVPGRVCRSYGAAQNSGPSGTPGRSMLRFGRQRNCRWRTPTFTEWGGPQFHGVVEEAGMPRTEYERELQEIEGELLEIGALVESSVKNALDALKKPRC